MARRAGVSWRPADKQNEGYSMTEISVGHLLSNKGSKLYVGTFEDC